MVYLVASGAVVALIIGLVLWRRRGGRDPVAVKRTGKTVFEKVEKAHKKDGQGSLIAQREQGFLSLIYGMAAAMIHADGRVEQVEIDQAEKLGKKLIPGFDGIAFRKIILHPEKLPPFSQLVDATAPLLPLDARIEIFQYLQAIATSDGNLSADERHYIHHVEMAYQLDKLAKH